MSINWVMLNQAGNDFTPLENESKLWTSQPRTSFLLHSLNKYPGREPISISSGTGRIHISNRRIVYIPDKATPQFQSFAAPIMNIHDSHVTTPFFGPNSWVAVIQPVNGGGIDSANSAIELRVTFKDGGAYEFHDKFSQTRERVQQALEIAHANGRGGRPGAGADLNSVHLDQLPAYEAGPSHSQPASPQPRQQGQGERQSNNSSANHPDEPPPDYDEVQREVVTEQLGQFGLKEKH